ncbi:MAG: hypothetical protein JXA03_02480 [Bacteroidales bacterium]|nr:hypothetical protein [Bacteroidales bacterium]
MLLIQVKINHLFYVDLPLETDMQSMEVALAVDLQAHFLNSGDYPYLLTSESPCIDAGKADTKGLSLPLQDIIGNYRIWDGDGTGGPIVDMGAYEFGSFPGDINEIRQNNLRLNVYVIPNPFKIFINFDYML